MTEYRASTLSDILSAKKFIEAIVNSIDDPVIGLNMDRQILFINEEALNVLNLKRENVIRKSAEELALKNDLLRRLIRELVTPSEQKEPLKIYADNKESYFKASYVPIINTEAEKDEPRKLGDVILLKNITEFKELDSAKTTFISTISHELKTPIAAIMMSLQLLEDKRVGALNDEQEQLSKSIKENSERLLGITGELLNMTQVEAGKLQLMPKITKPIELIEYAIKANQVQADKFNIQIEVEYPEEKIGKLFVDSEKIAWVLTNLLSNAIRYSKENGRVVIGAKQEDNIIELYVQDFGKGIDPRYHKSIFDRYFRVPGTKVQGSGLGLSISRDFVEAHGGTLTVESELGKGSHENTVLARAIRALGVYSEIYPHDITVEELKALPNVKGIIINGGPNNVIDGVAIDVNPAIYAMGIPVMAAGHDKAACEVKLAEFTDDIEAIKNAVKAFVFDTCKAEANWNMTNFVNDQIELIKRQVGDKKVLLALSGGVDSSVVAALLLKAIGDNLVCVHVNHGLMRKGESEDVVEVFSNQLKANLIYLDVTDRFLDKLAGVEDPEQKRKIIGSEFIRVFEEEARKLDGIDFLGQGTIYPDIVESGTKTAKMVKSHHNVGGLPEDLKFQLVEPLRQLFKDEVRACGLELGLPYEMVYRQPFPGPGLGVRCLGAITRDRLEAVRESDAILREEFQIAGLDKKVWQYFTVVPDFKSVGVRDNARSFDWPVIIRAVNTVDAMTATIEPIDWPVLMKITDRILKEVKNVNRVCYDMSCIGGITCIYTRRCGL